MKKVILAVACSLFLLGCNMNPSKEARIQKLETEIQQTMDKIVIFENRIQALEGENEDLKTRIVGLERR